MATTLPEATHMADTNPTQTQEERIGEANHAQLIQTEQGSYIGTSTEFTPDIETQMHTNWERLSPEMQSIITGHRQEVASIINGTSDTLGIIVGPCSVHDEEGMMEYLNDLASLQEKLNAAGASIKLIARIYGEKPRSSNSADGNGTLNWRGPVANPRPWEAQQDVIQTEEGLAMMERLMLHAYEKGIAVATEFLNMETVRELGHLVTVAAVGARTIEEPKFQHMAKAMGRLEISVGFKNDERGNPEPATRAMQAVSQDNQNAFLVLRGGKDEPNWWRYREFQRQDKAVCVDVNHSNSGKDLSATVGMLRQIAELPREQRPRLIMAESNTKEGKQPLEMGQRPEKDLSITDPGLALLETNKREHAAMESLIWQLAQAS